MPVHVQEIRQTFAKAKPEASYSGAFFRVDFSCEHGHVRKISPLLYTHVLQRNVVCPVCSVPLKSKIGTVPKTVVAKRNYSFTFQPLEKEKVCLEATNETLEETAKETLTPPEKPKVLDSHDAANALLGLQNSKELCELCHQSVSSLKSHVQTCIRGAYCKICGRLFPRTDPKEAPPAHVCAIGTPKTMCASTQAMFLVRKDYRFPLVQLTTAPVPGAQWVLYDHLDILLNTLILAKQGMRRNLLKVNMSHINLRTVRTNIERKLHKWSPEFRDRCLSSGLFPLRDPANWTSRRTSHSVTVVNYKDRLHFSIERSIISGGGDGLVAAKAFEKGVLLGYYEGDLLSKTDPDFKEWFKERGKHGYCMQLSGNIVVDGSECFNGLHKCQHDPINANVAMDKNGSGAIVTTRAIKEGEELFLSYGPSFFRQKKAEKPTRKKFLKKTKAATRKKTTVGLLATAAVQRPFFTQRKNTCWLYTVLGIISTLFPHIVQKKKNQQDVLPLEVEQALTRYFSLRVQGFAVLNHTVKEIVATLTSLPPSTMLGDLLARGDDVEIDAPLLIGATVSEYVQNTLDEAARLRPPTCLTPFPNVRGLNYTLAEADVQSMTQNRHVSGRVIDMLVGTFRRRARPELYVFPAGTNLRTSEFERLYSQATKAGVRKTLIFPTFVASGHWYVLLLDVHQGTVETLNSMPETTDPDQEQQAVAFAAFVKARQLCALCEEMTCGTDAWGCKCGKRLCGQCRRGILKGRETNPTLVQMKKLAKVEDNPVVDGMRCPFCQTVQIPLLPNGHVQRPLADISEDRRAFEEWQRHAYLLQPETDFRIESSEIQGKRVVATRRLTKGSYLDYPIVRSSDENSLFAVTTRNNILCDRPHGTQEPGHCVNEPMEDPLSLVMRVGFQVHFAPGFVRQTDLLTAINYLHQYEALFDRAFASPHLAPMSTFGSVFGTMAVCTGKNEYMDVYVGTYHKNVGLKATFNNTTETLRCPRSFFPKVKHGTAVALCVKMTKADGEESAELHDIRVGSTLPFDTKALFQQALRQHYRGSVPTPPSIMYDNTFTLLEEKLLPNSQYVESFVDDTKKKSKKRKRGKDLQTKIYIVLMRDVYPGQEITVPYGWGDLKDRLEKLFDKVYFTSPFCYDVAYPYPSIRKMIGSHIL